MGRCIAAGLMRGSTQGVGGLRGETPEVDDSNAIDLQPLKKHRVISR